MYCNSSTKSQTNRQLFVLPKLATKYHTGLACSTFFKTNHVHWVLIYWSSDFAVNYAFTSDWLNCLKSVYYSTVIIQRRKTTSAKKCAVLGQIGETPAKLQALIKYIFFRRSCLIVLRGRWITAAFYSSPQYFL